MPKSKAIDILEEIAAEVIVSDASDRQAMGALRELFVQLKASLPAQIDADISQAITRCLSDLTRLNKGCVKCPLATLEKVTERTCQLQHALLVGKPIRPTEMDGLPSASAASDLPTDGEHHEKDATDAQSAGQPTAPSAVRSAQALPLDFVLPDWVEESVFREFLANQMLVLEEIEGDILGLEKGDGALLDSLRRRLHTLKGEAGVLALEALEAVCHRLEDHLNTEVVGRNLIDLLFQARDWIGTALDEYATGRQPSPADWLPVAPSPADETPETSASEPRDAAAEPAEETSSADAGAELIATEAAGEQAPVEMARSPAAQDQPVSTEQEQHDSDADATADAAELRPEPTRVQRDEETIALLAEFLQEGGDGLTKADQLLMNAEQDGIEPEMVNGLFRVFHTIKGVAGFLELSDISSLAHNTETMLNQVRQGKLDLSGVALDLVFEATDTMRKMLDGVRRSVEGSLEFERHPELKLLLTKLQAVIDGVALADKPVPPVSPNAKLGEVLQQTAAVKPEDVERALETQKQSGRRLGEELVAQGAVQPRDVVQALRAQQRSAMQAGQEVRIRETIKVDLERVDRLVETIGELVIVESMVVNTPEIADMSSLRVRNYLGQLSKITRDLQDMGMRMRMVPVRSLFQKMARMVRDLSRKNNKQIQLVQSGEGSEMDRSMVEQLADPLVHMIRNAVDHGIETDAQRRQAGKSNRATIRLSAFHEGGSIVIEVSDDGRGLDREAILNKAINQGLVKDGAKLSNQEVYDLIFAPGFSTARKVTEISGRGVGMDVVRRNIEAMRGRINITSTPGQGSNFKMMLPLTLAIIDGMLVSCGSERYIIPTLSIVESIQPEPSMVLTYAHDHEMINVRGKILPLFRLNRLLDIEGAKTDPLEALVVVVENLDRRIGLLVDDVVTQQQVVIKSTGSVVDDIKYIAGAAILADGHVGLILNVEELSGLAVETTHPQPEDVERSTSAALPGDRHAAPAAPA